MTVSWKESQGKKYLYCDISNSVPEQSSPLVDELIIILGSSSGQLLFLANIENAVISPEFMKKAKLNGKLFQDKIKKSAVVGVKGLKKMLMNSYIAFTGSKFKLFDSEEEALKYLTSAN